jgi:uncharacterized protein involved in exopolysaccharide biosynthesis
MSADSRSPEEQGEINLLELLIVLAKHKKMIAATTLAAALISLLVALLLPKVYTGAATIMPPQKDQSSAVAVLGQLIGGGATAGGGIASALGLKNPNDLYVGILKSRTIADRLIDRFKLKELYDQETLVETREELADNTTITAGKDGLITVEFEDKDPKRAAGVANAYVEELELLTANLAISEASQRRLYFQKQVDQTRESLARADSALKDVQEQTGLIKPDDQAKPIFEAVATLRGQIAVKEVELAAMKTFATDRNPDYIRVQEQLRSMKKQLAGLETDNQLGRGDILVPTSKIPEAGLEYLRKFRDVKYYETVYELLARQLELAKVEEGKNAIIIQLVDKAIEPDKKSKPKRALIVILATLMAAVLAAFWALIKEAHEQARSDPSQTERMSRLREYLFRK